MGANGVQTGVGMGIKWAFSGIVLKRPGLRPTVMQLVAGDAIRDFNSSPDRLGGVLGPQAGNLKLGVR